MKNKPGDLYILPGYLGDESDPDYLCGFEIRLIQHLKCFYTENEKSARRFLRKSGYRGPFEEIFLHKLDKQTSITEQQKLIEILLKGTDAGILSEAGAPALADPGASLIRMAHQQKIRVIPIPGPSAIMLAIMASGLNGQQFSFNGYLPIEKNERAKRISALEELSSQTGYAQFFIETPYRNQALFADLIKRCKPETELSLSVNLTQTGAWTKTLSVSSWRENIPDLQKIPVVFGLLHRKFYRI